MTSLNTKPAPFGPVAPTEVRYIKLGLGGAWTERCLQDGLIELDHANIPHALAAPGDWDAVAQAYRSGGVSPGKATDFTRELRDFYTLPSSTLWITFHAGRLWWAFAEPDVEAAIEPGRGARARRVIGAWRSTDVEGAPLLTDSLSTRLTKVAAYRQTVCRVEQADYLIRRINAEPEPLVAQALAAQAQLTGVTAALIQGLHWRDFEVLADLIFAGSGWRRISAVGGSSQADSDLILEQAATGERAMVQVKSSADQAVIDDYAARYRAGAWDRCFLICHSPRGQLTRPVDPTFHLWGGDALAHQAIAAGLLPWLIEKAR